MSKKAIYLEFSLLMVEGKKELKAGVLEQFQKWLSDNEICVYILGTEDKNEIKAILTQNGLSQENIKKISIRTPKEMNFNVEFKKDIIRNSLLDEDLFDAKELIFYGVDQGECRQVLESKSHMRSFGADLFVYYVDPKGHNFLEGSMKIDPPDEGRLKQIYNCLVAVVKSGQMESIEFLLSQYCEQNGNVRSIAVDLVTVALQAGHYELAHDLSKKLGTNIQDISMHSFLDTPSPFIGGIISFLSEYVINIDQIDMERGETALCKAARLVNLPAVKMLISKGANVEQCDFEGCSPVYYIATLSDVSKLSEAMEIFKYLTDEKSWKIDNRIYDLVDNITFPADTKITLKDAQLIIDYRTKISHCIKWMRAVDEYRYQLHYWGIDPNAEFFQKRIEQWRNDLKFTLNKRDIAITNTNEAYDNEFNKLLKGDYSGLGVDWGQSLAMPPVFSSPLATVTAATGTTTNTAVATTTTTDMTRNTPATASVTSEYKYQMSSL